MVNVIYFIIITMSVGHYLITLTDVLGEGKGASLPSTLHSICIIDASRSEHAGNGRQTLVLGAKRRKG